MLVLALETTGKYGSAALIDGKGNIACSSSSTEMNHLKDIVFLADECIKKMGVEKKDIDYIATDIGPGSFTGIRIGVTTARTMAQMLGLKCIAVSSLEALALEAIPETGDEEYQYVCPIINARRHQTYAGMWMVDGFVEELPQKQYMIEEIIDEVKKLDGKVLFTGDGIDAYASIIEETLPSDKFAYTSEPCRYQTAEFIAWLALDKIKDGKAVSYGELMPNYMRLSEAEQRLKEGTLSKKITEA